MKKFLSVVLISLVGIGLFSFTNDDKYFELAKNVDIFAALYAEVNKYYVDEVNPNQMIKKGIDAMLEELDPYTVYIPEDDIEDYRTNATGEYGGIGILSNKLRGKHLILNLYADSPAEKAGLKIGDEIIAIDGKEIVEMSDEQAGRLLKGQSGSLVLIGVLRNGKEKKEFEVHREKIVIPNISYQKLIRDSIGYFRLSEFTRTAGDDVLNAVTELKKQGATSLIIDLRGNPGGLLNEAVKICNLFVPKGSKIVETKGKTAAQSFTYDANDPSLDLDIPIAVLIDQNSASASEIVSGVIQDYDRGVIVGKKSYGKGLVQVSRPLSFNSQLKVTTAKYYIPSGRCIQALDYIHKNADGSAGIIPDSLKRTFKTANQRTVRDGGGVDPDVIVDVDELSSFAKNLQESGIVFDYATNYYYEHESIPDPKSFELSEQEYTLFVQWAKNKPFENKSKIEEGLDLLREAAQADKAYLQLINEIDGLNKAVRKVKSNGFTTFKSEIKTLLEHEIIKRYYLTTGVLEATLDKDEYVYSALDVLADTSRYNKILMK